MPQIPVYESRTSAPRPVGATLMPATSVVGDALGRAGQAVEQYGDRQLQIDVRKAEEAAALEGARVLADFKLERTRDVETRARAAPAGAPGFTDSLLSDYDSSAEKLLSAQADPRVKRYLQERLVSYRQQLGQDGLNFEAGARRAKIASDFDGALNASRNTVLSRPDSFSSAYGDSMAAIEALDTDAATKARLRAEAGAGLALSAAQGEIGLNPVAALKKLKGGGWDAHLDADNKAALINRAEAEIAQAEAERKRQAAETRQRLVDTLEDYRFSLSQGVPVDAMELAQAARLARGLGRGELANSITKLGVQNLETVRARTLTPVELQDEINRLNGRIAAAGGQASALDMMRRDALERTQSAMTSALKSDPLSWAVKAGRGQLTPVDPDAPDPAALARRRLEARAVAREYGTAPRYFTDEEAAAFKARLDSARPAEKVSLARSLAAGLGPDAPRALREIAPDPVFDLAGSLAGLSARHARTAERIFAGQEAWKNNKSLTPRKVDAEAVQAERVGQAMTWKPQDRKALVAAGAALYALEASRRGLTPDEFDEGLYRDALNEAAGGVRLANGDWMGGLHRRRGVELVLPPTLTADDFDRRLDRMTDADVQRASVGRTPAFDARGGVRGAEAIRRGYLWDAGGGRYFVSVDKAGTQFLQGGGPGGRYVLDINQLSPSPPPTPVLPGRDQGVSR